MKVYLPKEIEHCFKHYLNINRRFLGKYEYEFVNEAVLEFLEKNPEVVKLAEKSAKDLEIARIKTEMSDNLIKHQQLLDKLKELEK